MDFEGTTSVSQFRASSVEDAVRLWRKGLSQPRKYGLTELQRKRLVGGYSHTELGLPPTPLEGLKSVWCDTVSAKRKGFALLNIVETLTQSES
jgi:hypothetical protein